MSSTTRSAGRSWPQRRSSSPGPSPSAASWRGLTPTSSQPLPPAERLGRPRRPRATAAPDRPRRRRPRTAAAEVAAATVPDHTAHHTPVGGRARATSRRRTSIRCCRPSAPGTVHEYTIPLKDVTMEIAPGVTYSAWTFAGGAPGPTIHVRQGDTVKVTLRNDGRDPALDRLPRGPHRAEPGVQGREARRELLASSSSPTIPACSCTTAARRRCSRTSPTACTARSSSTRRAACRRPTAPTSWSAASGTLNGDGKADAGRHRHGEGARAGAGLRDLERLRGPVQGQPAAGRGRRERPLLRRGRGPELRHRLPRRRHACSTAPTWTARPRAQFRNLQTVSVPAGGGARLRRAASTRTASTRSSATPSPASTSDRSAWSRSATSRAR